MPAVPDNRLRHVATLWQLTMNEDRVRCTVYGDGPRLELRIESPTSVIVAEPFDLQPRMLARSRALRASLKRRGWSEPSAAQP